MFERISRMRNLAEIPRLVMESPHQFFKKCFDEIKDPLKWVGELYFELHQATYTTHARVKRGNRLGEIGLHDVELFSSLTYALNLSEYDGNSLETLWKLLLLNQFHDILPGSSIHSVYQDTYAQHDYIQEQLNKLLSIQLETILSYLNRERQKQSGVADHHDIPIVTAFNSIGWHRREVVELDDNIPISPLQFSSSQKPLIIIEAPPYGWQDNLLHPDNISRLLQETGTVRISEDHDQRIFVMENSNLRCCISSIDGSIKSVYEKNVDREAIDQNCKSGANRFVLYEDIPLFWDAWDVMIYHLEKGKEVSLNYLSDVSPKGKIIEKGPLRTVVQFEHKIGESSHLTQRISLSATSQRLDFHTEVDWKESHKFLKVKFPLNVRSETATYQIAYGQVSRPTHSNTSWDMAKFEVCGQYWAAISEWGFGVAIINDSKYGYSATANTLTLSLLRSSKAPDESADMGVHHFSYSIFPFSSFTPTSTNGVVRESHTFNFPMHFRTGLLSSELQHSSQSFFSVNRNNIVIDTVKKAEDHHRVFVIRLYEAYGGTARQVHLTSTLSFKRAVLCNLVEDEENSDLPLFSSTLGVTIHLGKSGRAVIFRPFHNEGKCKKACFFDLFRSI